ncbi:hypothetical protein [Alicyclobacillus acidiphilus]|uniref:hypothetical protein n=1 Tax=Alicyclobacillus acidiphilus TaxID=182455 RepID=UPI000833AB7A|nr:hypothetical protein [Alicyclobacillus acidiphilus]
MARDDRAKQSDRTSTPEERLARGKIWLIMLGILGGLIVIFSVAVTKFASGISILGFVIGFFCMVVGAMAVFSKRDK